MLQLLSLYLNKDKDLQFTSASGSEVHIYRSVVKLIAIISYAKTFNFKIITSRIEVGNIRRICEPLDLLTDETF